jgi:hypothetical protein
VSIQSVKVPSYRHHKGSGQAFVQFKGKRHYLGKYGTDKSQEAHRRFIARLVASPLKQPPESVDQRAELLIVELAVAYWDYAQGYYRKNEIATTSLRYVKRALTLLRNLYGSTESAKFGPLALKAIQQHLVMEGVARRTVNQYIDAIRRVFRWATSQELIPPIIYQGLITVPGLIGSPRTIGSAIRLARRSPRPRFPPRERLRRTTIRYPINGGSGMAARLHGGESERVRGRWFGNKLVGVAAILFTLHGCCN